MHRSYSWRLSAANKMEVQAFDGRARTVLGGVINWDGNEYWRGFA
jgi:hypothetical protein